MRLTSRTIVGSGEPKVPARLIRPVLALGMFLLLFGMLGVVHAAPPANDTCAGAEVIPGNLGFPVLSSLIPDLTEATPLSTATPDTVEPSCLPFVSRSIWFQFTPVQAGMYRISLGRDTGTTVVDTVMAMYTSANGCAGPFTEVACNDDAGVEDPDILKSAFVSDLTGGVTYYIVVWLLGDYPPDSGFTAVQVGISQPVAPPNDFCFSAMTIPGNGPFPFLTTPVDTFLATETPEEPIPSCQGTEYTMRTVWYEFTPTRTALFSVATCADTGTRVFDTVVSVYTSTNGCAGPLEEVSCDDDGCGFKSNVQMMMVEGTTYYIMVSDAELDAAVVDSEVQLRITNPPEAITLPATQISSAGATLNGLVRPNGLTTTFFFEYGTNTDYGQRGPIQIQFSSVTEAVTNYVATNITANTLYHFRLVANNPNGEALGEDQTFVYSTTPPELGGMMVPAGGGSFEFQFSGSVGQVYGVQRSTNLIHWINLGLPVDLGTGLFHFVDPDPPTVPARFYRVAVP